MPITYEKIQSTTLGAANNTITLSSIPGTYTDLRLVFNGKADPSNSPDYLAMRFNSDTASNYSSTVVRANGSTASSTRNIGDSFIFIGFTTIDTSTPELHTVDIFSYAGPDYKACLTTSSKDLNGSGFVVRGVELWRNTAAITTITLSTPNIGKKFDIGTTVTLYGILKA
jgi:hypothetical protein